MRTIVRLSQYGTKLMSRSEARRLLRGLEESREVVLNFKDVDLVGPGFADEVFRVWVRDHPDTTLIPTDMNEAVALIVERAIRHAAAD